MGQHAEEEDVDEGVVAEVHLSNVEDDPGETTTLVDSEPEITSELKQLAEDWRDGIEDRWERDYSSADYEYVVHGMV